MSQSDQLKLGERDTEPEERDGDEEGLDSAWLDDLDMSSLRESLVLPGVPFS